MKNHIFSLILSAAILTTNPLFGMESENHFKDKIIRTENIIVENPVAVYLRENTNLFSDLQKEYTVPFFMLEYFMRQNGRVLYGDQVATYKFSIGGRSLVLFFEYNHHEGHPLSAYAVIPLCASVLMTGNLTVMKKQFSQANVQSLSL